ncbi:hypothetical protein HK101_008486 [Irineochytrium annulatum]|nr:hypothetical protein HK101_008486 [Irineochytrium annulatum]
MDDRAGRMGPGAEDMIQPARGGCASAEEGDGLAMTAGGVEVLSSMSARARVLWYLLIGTGALVSILSNVGYGVTYFATSASYPTMVGSMVYISADVVISFQDLFVAIVFLSGNCGGDGGKLIALIKRDSRVRTILIALSCALLSNFVTIPFIVANIDVGWFFYEGLFAAKLMVTKCCLESLVRSSLGVAGEGKGSTNSHMEGTAHSGRNVSGFSGASKASFAAVSDRVEWNF